MLGAAFSGFAMVAMIAIVMRHAFQLKHLVTDRHMDVLAKVLLASGLMTAYGYVFEVFDAFYSGDVHEIATVHDRFFGPYAWSYWGAVVLNFVPLQLLWLRSVRRSPVLLFLIGTSVVVGMWLERYMILVTSLYKDFLPSSFGMYHAAFWDWSTYIGMIGLFLRRSCCSSATFRRSRSSRTRKCWSASWRPRVAERVLGYLAEFGDAEALVEAAKQARAAGFRRLDAFTPFPSTASRTSCASGTIASVGSASSAG